MKLKRETSRVDGGGLFFGILLGLVAGGLATLFIAPRSGAAFRRQFSSSVSEAGQNLRAGVEAIVPTDPVAESMAEGKAAARRRLGELGNP